MLCYLYFTGDGRTESNSNHRDVHRWWQLWQLCTSGVSGVSLFRSTEPRSPPPPSSPSRDRYTGYHFRPRNNCKWTAVSAAVCVRVQVRPEGFRPLFRNRMTWMDVWRWHVMCVVHHTYIQRTLTHALTSILLYKCSASLHLNSDRERNRERCLETSSIMLYRSMGPGRKM